MISFHWNFKHQCYTALFYFLSRMAILRTPTIVILLQTWRKSSMPQKQTNRRKTPHCSTWGQNPNVTSSWAITHWFSLTWCLCNPHRSVQEHIQPWCPLNAPWESEALLQGSLTTPPCYESILWTVFDTPITLSHNQVRPPREPSAPKLFFSRTDVFLK